MKPNFSAFALALSIMASVKSIPITLPVSPVSERGDKGIITGTRTKINNYIPFFNFGKLRGQGHNQALNPHQDYNPCRFV